MAGRSARGELLHAWLRRSWPLYAMILPGLVFVLIFRYLPMYGIVIAFQDFSPARGFAGSPWVGLENFDFLFSLPEFNRIFGNTIIIAVLKLVLDQLGAIVLAAGMSRRMGCPKLLLPWADGRTILEHLIMQLLLARVHHITVVTGHCAAETGRIARKYDVRVVHNPRHATGEMLSSLQAGLASLPPQIGGALVLPGDQPRITPRVINQVLMGWAEGRGRIVAPVHAGRRGHPVLFERRFWREILELPAGQAPREILRRRRDELALVEVANDCVLSDVDTPADYERERRLAGLTGAGAQ